ncbi:MAG: glycosyltransferase family 39 protein [bacterium]|nr:glycosyltransferase family 39 protein [bacterium]
MGALSRRDNARGFYDAPAVLFGGLCGIVAAAFTYDAAERMLGAGRGVYASAVLATFIPTAIVISEPPLMSHASLLFVTSAALWMAARATESNVREALALIGLLSGVVSQSLVYGRPPCCRC